MAVEAEDSGGALKGGEENCETAVAWFVEVGDGFVAAAGEVEICNVVNICSSWAVAGKRGSCSWRRGKEGGRFGRVHKQHTVA